MKHFGYSRLANTLPFSLFSYLVNSSHLKNPPPFQRLDFSEPPAQVWHGHCPGSEVEKTMSRKMIVFVVSIVILASTHLAEAQQQAKIPKIG
jgi:hypothetical protein